MTLGYAQFALSNSHIDQAGPGEQREENSRPHLFVTQFPTFVGSKARVRKKDKVRFSFTRISLYKFTTSSSLYYLCVFLSPSSKLLPSRYYFIFSWPVARYRSLPSFLSFISQFGRGRERRIIYDAIKSNTWLVQLEYWKDLVGEFNYFHIHLSMEWSVANNGIRTLSNSQSDTLTYWVILALRHGYTRYRIRTNHTYFVIALLRCVWRMLH